MTAKGRILVVDDDRLVLATVTHGLTQAGYDVIDADNGDDAILLAREHRPDLALLDIRMHGKSGFDVAEYLRDVARLPFMFLSAFADDETRAKVEELGAQAYLVKPLEVAQIVPVVDEVLARLRASPPVAAPAPPAAAGDLIALATGILMHRYSLSRAGAARRLAQQAGEKGLTLAVQAGRIVGALEELAGSSDSA